jgi:hypothetical protein
MAQLFVNDEFVGRWKEAVVVYLEVLSQNLPRGPEENNENLSHDNWSPSRGCNAGSPEYKTGMVLARPTGLARTLWGHGSRLSVCRLTRAGCRSGNIPDSHSNLGRECGMSRDLPQSVDANAGIVCLVPYGTYIAWAEC